MTALASALRQKRTIPHLTLMVRLLPVVEVNSRSVRSFYFIVTIVAVCQRFDHVFFGQRTLILAIRVDNGNRVV